MNSKFPVVVLYLEYAVNLGGDGGVLHGGLDELAHQVVDGGHDVGHLLACDAAVAVDVVQRERPAQLLVQGAARQDRQSVHEVLRQTSSIVHTESVS